ncbi:MAG: HEAT repeat domain-containing protein [Elusimicrobiota bacterium]|jgi:HEAT repeat protein
MKQLAIVLVVVAVGWIGFAQFKQRVVNQEPPPPPPPPAIVMPPPQVLDEEQLERVKSATSDAEPRVRWEALQVLMSSQDPRAEGIMFQMLKRDGESDIRKNVVNVLAGRRGPQVTEHLIGALKDMDGDVRLAALEALGKSGDAAAAPAISDALRDGDERVRLTALRILNDFQRKRNEEILEKKRLQEEAQRKYEEALKQQQQGGKR